jgi:sodium transport system permease protein
MSAFGVILRKETKDHFRDRRSVLSALLMPMLGPLVFAATFGLVARQLREGKELEIAVANAQAAPSLVQFLERHGARTSPAPAGYEALVRDGKLDVVLVVGEDYVKEFNAGRAAPVRLVMDGSRTRTSVSVRRAQRLLQAYAGELGALRLLARGVSPQLASPLAIEETDLATPQKTAAQVLGMVPLFLLVAAFMGGLHLAIDSTAGERERQSLEPLLINPVRPREVVLGKWLATVLVTWVAVGVTLFGFLAVLQRVPLADLGLRVRVGLPEVAGMLSAVLPVTLFSAGLQMLVATFARTFKEGQTYASLLAMVPMIPGLFFMFSPGKAAAWMMGVPILSQTVLMSELLRGDTPPLSWFALSALSAGLFAAACVSLTVRLLGSEKVIFGR